MQNVLLQLQTIALDWSLETFLMNLKDKAKVWGSGVIMVLGVAMIIVAVWQIAKGFMGGGKTQTNWAMSILCGLIGGVLLAGGWNTVGKISKGAGKSLENLGGPNNNGSALSEAGEGHNEASETIILPFGTTTAYIDIK